MITEDSAWLLTRRAWTELHFKLKKLHVSSSPSISQGKPRAGDARQPRIQVTGLNAQRAVVPPTGEHRWAGEAATRLCTHAATPHGTAATKHRSRRVGCGMAGSSCKTRQGIGAEDSRKGKTRTEPPAQNWRGSTSDGLPLWVNITENYRAFLRQTTAPYIRYKVILVPHYR